MAHCVRCCCWLLVLMLVALGVTVAVVFVHSRGGGGGGGSVFPVPGSIDIATSPVFPDAEVELRCAGKVVAGATTNSNGSFVMEADLTSGLAPFLGGCRLVVGGDRGWPSDMT